MTSYRSVQYEIRVECHLGSTVAALFPEFELSPDNGNTVMRGSLPDHPAVYTIRVQGLIGERWFSYLDNLEMEVGGEDRAAITTLTELVVDQAALQGVLQHLYSLGLVLLRVECEEDRDGLYNLSGR